MHGLQSAATRIALEEREISHPEKAPRLVVDECESTADVLPHPVERGARHMIRARHQQRQISLGKSKPGYCSFMQELRRRTSSWPFDRLSLTRPPAPAPFALCSISSTCLRESVAPPGTRIPRTRPPCAIALLAIVNSVSRKTSLASKISSS